MSKKKSQSKKEPEKKAPSQSGGKKFMPVIAMLAVVVIAGAYYVLSDKVDIKKSAVASEKDVSSLRGGETKKALPSGLFVGRTAAAYQIASANPELLDAMYCYCYCSKTIGHRSLLSCFTDHHAANCGICQDQAFYADALFKKGLEVADIRQAVDQKYWKPMR